MLDFWNFLCCRTTKALASLRKCADSPEPSLIAYINYGCKRMQTNMRGSRNFRQGGQVSLTKKLWQLFFFLVLSLFYRSQKVNFKEIYHRGGAQHFPGRVQLFPEWVQLLILYRNRYNLWFSRGGGGVRTPCPPPLWILTWLRFRPLGPHE